RAPARAPPKPARTPALATMSLNSRRSSPRRIASMSAPISSTLYLSSTPDSCSATAVLSAVCPPSVASSASGRSRAMTCSTKSGVIGSMYVASANSGSVMMVAGLELMRLTRSPSARSTRHAWVPEESNSHACPMTIGPEPMTRMCDRSLRLGIRTCSDQLNEPVEQVVGVVRAGRRLRVVLDGERRYVPAAQPLDHVVVEAHVRHLHL